jgi:transcriptional regulator with XRE-family HTH domain
MARSRKTAFGHLVGNCFGVVLRQYREAAHVSQEALAMEAEIDRRYVQLLENGTSQPTLEILLRLTRALKIESRDAMGKTESLVVKKEANADAGSASGQTARARGRQASPVRSRRRQNSE